MSSEAWARIQSLFDVALFLEATQRADYLSRECGANTALRLEIESLIAASAAAGDKVDGLMALAARELAASVVPGPRKSAGADPVIEPPAPTQSFQSPGGT
jgi:hypothetical protein